MLLREICNRQQVFARHDRTRRIVRITNEQDLRPWCHVLLELGGRDAEFILLLGGHGDGNAASENRAGLIGDVAGLGDEHLVDVHIGHLRRKLAAVADLAPGQGGTVLVGGLCTEVRTINSRRGRMAVATLDDRSGRLDLVVYSDLFAQCREVLGPDRVLVAEGELTLDERTGGASLIATRVQDLDQARALYGKRLLIQLDAGPSSEGILAGLAPVLRPFQEGPTPVYIEYRRPDASARLRLGEEWRVSPTEKLLRRLGELAGPDRVRIEY